MQHPEEGIIHAWIDGALSPAEATALEAHVASCAECAARVAEARGLVAASSRIISHLDAVPANVIPAKPIRRRSWTRSAWPVAIAATLVLGISLYSREKQPPSNATGAVAADSALFIAANTREAAANVPPKARTVQPPRQVAADQGPVAQKSERVSLRAGVTADMQASVAASAPPPSAPAPVAPQTSAASAAAPTPVTATELRAPETRGEPAAGSRTAIAVGGSAAGAAAAPARAQRAARTELQMESQLRDAGNSEAVAAFTGCYDLGVSTDILPARFALTSDTSGAMPGLLAIRYLDGSGRPSDRLADAGWVIEGGRAVVKTLGRGRILSLAKTGSEVVGDSPNGPRTGRVASCR